MTVCAYCGRDNATHYSPSGIATSAYCDGCAIMRCGHSIEQFVYDAGIAFWVDPCVAKWQPKKALREHWMAGMRG